MNQLRYFIVVCTLGLLPFYLSAQSSKVVIEGECAANVSDFMSIYTNKGFEKVFYTSNKPSDNGTFGLVFYPDHEGLFFIETSELKIPLYLKGGEHLNIKLDEIGAYTLKKASKLNSALQHSKSIAAIFNDKLSKEFERGGSATEVCNLMNNYKVEIEAYKAKCKLKAEEKNYLDAQADIDFYSLANKVLMTLFEPGASGQQVDGVLKQVLTTNINTTDTWQYFTDISNVLLDNISVKLQFNNQAEQLLVVEDVYSIIDNHVDNAQLKGLLMVEALSRFTVYDEIEKALEDVDLDALPEECQRLIIDKVLLLQPLAKNKIAPEFTLEDIDGNMVSLSDFHGKVVIIDFWATWCAPCMQESPYLNKLADKYKDKDLVVVGISVDKARDKAYWKKMVKEKNMRGVQLFNGNASGGVANMYKVEGIPRFVVIDKEGVLVSAKAPRPSQPTLTRMVERLLKK